MGPDFRKAFRGLGGGNERSDGSKTSGIATPLSPIDLEMTSGTTAAGMPATFPARLPETAQSAPTPASSMPLPATPAPADPGPAATSPAPPLSASARLAKELGVPDGKPDSVLDLRAQAAAILTDVIADLVRESRLEAPEVVEEKRQTREQDYARLLEDSRETRPTSILEDVDRTMRRKPRARERRGRGRLY